MSEKGNKIEDNYYFDTYGRQKNQKPIFRLSFLALIIAVFAICYWFVVVPPSDFPKNTTISIPVGTSLSKASVILKQSSIVKSPLLFRLLVRFFSGQNGVKAGSYLFEEPQNVITVAKRLTAANRGFAPIVVAIPEGTSVSQISEILGAKISNFDKKEFFKLAAKKEGYLFPDTYNFDFDVSPQVVLDAMLSNFNKKIDTIKNELNDFGRPLSDVINMASIVEEEGRTTETRRIVAGVLWKRLDMGMPLQVDAVFFFINGKTTFQLATSDLETDSPYNTYTRKGLPPTPITNPGLDAILATITPIKTPYFFYLTGEDDKMHYAVTYAEHLANKDKYLK